MVKKKEQQRLHMGDQPIARENPFKNMAKLFHESVGKLPAHLVMLFVVSLSAAVACGLVLHFAAITRGKDKEFLPLRLSVDSAQPAITENFLRGSWASQKGPYIATLRMGNGLFELVIRSTSSPYTRGYIRGGYRFSGNVLVMQTRKDLGAAFDPDHYEIKYMPLEFHSLNMYIHGMKTGMMWEIPSSEQSRMGNPQPALGQILTAPIEWTKLDSTP